MSRGKTHFRYLSGGGVTLETFLTLLLCCERCWQTPPTLALRNVSSACSMPLLVKIKKMPSGTTLSWQCSRSTTNAISEVLLFCVCVCVCVMRYIFICILFSLGVRCVCVCVCVCVCIYLSTYVSIYMFLVLAVPEVPVLESAICVCVCLLLQYLWKSCSRGGIGVCVCLLIILHWFWVFTLRQVLLLNRCSRRSTREWVYLVNSHYWSPG